MRARLTRLLAAFGLGTLTLACASIPANTDPQARAAYYANDAVLRLGEIQSATIDAHAHGGLADRDAIAIVTFTVSATKTVQQTPYGWFPLVKQAYTEVRPHITLPAGSPVTAAFALLDVLLLKVQPQGP